MRTVTTCALPRLRPPPSTQPHAPGDVRARSDRSRVPCISARSPAPASTPTPSTRPPPPPGASPATSATSWGSRSTSKSVSKPSRPAFRAPESGRVPWQTTPEPKRRVLNYVPPALLTPTGPARVNPEDLEEGVEVIGSHVSYGPPRTIASRGKERKYTVSAPPHLSAAHRV